YMAWGLPWVGSAVGENLVAAGANEDQRGLTVSTTAQWARAIQSLAEDQALRLELGQRGRAYVERVHDRVALARQLGVFWRSLVSWR
ncbi:MAG: glycosyltransferase, partial [Planctomycetota bacterium]